jgi:hypothetical protein
MRLADIIANLQATDDSLCIIARRPWTADSVAKLVAFTDDYRVPEDALLEGYEYFLGVNTALEEVVGDLRSRLSAAQRLDACIHYAEYDAYPAWLDEFASTQRSPGM